MPERTQPTPTTVTHPNGLVFRVIPAASYTARTSRDVRNVVMSDGNTWTVGQPIGWYGTPAAWRTTEGPALANRTRPTAAELQTKHALTVLAAATPGRRRHIAAAAEDYLGQIDRRRLPIGFKRAILDDGLNRIDAYHLRHGHEFAKALGLGGGENNPGLGEVARAVLAAIDAPIQRLTACATQTGQPILVAVLHVAAGVHRG
ncbi:hypothetical protein ACFXGT_08170 [Streptomyces sp. NPDC059352]|uniref:hypothetical protein n=1 Tax=Streptomyces sp. NPDC059352 TaxID=3346810 RepID=UPI0036809844